MENEFDLFQEKEEENIITLEPDDLYSQVSEKTNVPKETVKEIISALVVHQIQVMNL